MNSKILQMGLALVMTTGLLASCYKDNGNYDYISEDEALKVTLGPLESQSVKANAVLHIEPAISGDEDGQFSYLWYTLSSGDYNVSRDTLSQERELNAPVNLKEGKYTLYYQVTNEANGVYRAVSAPLTVSATDITSGWYVMKEIEGGVDFDYHSLSSKNDAFNFMTASLGMAPMAGKPVGMIFQNGTYATEIENADGTTTKESNLTAFHIMTSKDYVTLSGSDFSVLKTLDQQFYEAPEAVNFNLLYIDTSMHDYGVDYCYMINDGKYHSLGNDVGKWGYKAAGDYHLLPTLIGAEFYTFAYDDKNKQVVTTYDGIACAQDFYGTDVTELQDSNMVVSNVVSHIDGYSAEFYLVGTSGNTGKNYVINVALFTPYVYYLEYFESPADSRLFSSTVMASTPTSSVIYFADGEKLYAHHVATGEDRLVKSFAAGQEISFIKNVSGTESDGTAFDDLVVITNGASGYSVYRFPLVGSAGELNTEVGAAMSGTGKASYLMFRQE